MVGESQVSLLIVVAPDNHQSEGANFDPDDPVSLHSQDSWEHAGCSTREHNS